MTTTIRPPAPHDMDSITCWCQPEIVQVGQRGEVVLAKLAHNDTLGWSLSLLAATRLYDSRLQHEGEE